MPGSIRMHRPQGWRPPAKAKRDSDKQRGTPSQRGYDWQWRKYSKSYRAENKYCRRHWDLFRRSVFAQQVDHIVIHKGQSDPLFWDTDNHQPLCTDCGTMKSGVERHGKRFTREEPYPDASYGDPG